MSAHEGAAKLSVLLIEFFSERIPEVRENESGILELDIYPFNSH